MEQLDLIKITPDGKRSQKQDAKTRPHIAKAQEDDFFELLSRSQSKRMDDQRCSIKINRHGSNNSNSAAVATASSRKPLQQQNSIQNSSAYPNGEGANCLPGLKTTASNNSSSSSSGHPQLARSATTTEQVDDEFLEMLMRSQGSRLEEQRSELPRPNAVIDAEAQPRSRPAAARGGTTVPDEDFFSLIMKVQSGRMEDQRAAIPMSRRDAPSSSNK